MTRTNAQPLTMGFFSSFSPPAWHAADDRTYGDDWWSGDHFVRLAQKAENAGFDFMFFEDTAGISRIGGSLDLDVKNVFSSPKNDPVALITYLSAVTSRIGLIATASTSLYPPFLLARLYSTIDCLSKGRVGWNIVTSSEKEAAQNFGYDDLPPTEQRYAMAEEFMQVVNALWNSWDRDAVIQDVAHNIYADPSKVHEINHAGKHFKVRGPLNSFPSPQGKPVFAQAGGSGPGRDFAAKHAEIIMSTTIGGVKTMKAFREDIHERMRKFGREPGSCKILYLTRVYVADSVKAFRDSITDEQLFRVAGTHSAHLGVDLTQYDLNKPLPEDAVSNGTTSMFEALKEKGRKGQSIRDGLIDFNWGDADNGQIGPAGEVAEHLIDMMQEAGGDGYIIGATKEANAAFLSGIFDGVVPELKKRGAMRAGVGGTLRNALFAS